MGPGELNKPDNTMPGVGRFEVIVHSLEFSSLGRANLPNTRIFEAVTKDGVKLAIAVPAGEDPTPYIRRAEELSLHETEGTISITGVEDGREEV